MEMEEYIKKTVAEGKGKEYEDQPDNYSACKIAMDYFPFTEECPVDGHDCQCNQCPHGYYDEVCLHHETHRVFYKVFGEYETGNCYQFGNYDHYITPRLDLSTLHRKSWSISLRGDNGVIDWWVLGKLRMKKDFDKHSWPPRMEIPISKRNLKKLEKILLLFKSKEDKILKYYNDYHICSRCNKHQISVTAYKSRKTLCDDCKNEIAEEFTKSKRA